ncbi:AT-hook motif nuclear-localized protein 3-like isoform X2 [Diospyros lotus]|uniref:AT-hook motif nuclear-localized protein 3-like isoform X2 n=1 Tax=Diospyros lotus TaxID=55363 RepID=UPI002253257E|nr:AT-hook motif nuclear-localized protein 3-like isoform X2 [Diospyros lotus]
MSSCFGTNPCWHLIGRLRYSDNEVLPTLRIPQFRDCFECSNYQIFHPLVLLRPQGSTGQDTTRKIVPFTMLGPQAVCIIPATGLISSATLKQADSSRGTLTYEVWLLYVS